MFDAVEINSSFYRPHRRATYQRWAASVPDDFRFAVKLPKAITHERRLADSGELLDRFLDETDGLGSKRGPILIQLPPSLNFDAAVAGAFFAELRRRSDGDVACEPRHASWFAPEPDALLVAHRIARVAADPPPVAGADVAGGWDGLTYTRLHGSPVIYRSDYPPDAIARHAAHERYEASSWTIFDNTMLGFATLNALAMRAALAG